MAAHPELKDIILPKDDTPKAFREACKALFPEEPTVDSLYNQIVKPVFKRYKNSLLYFADPNVNATTEGYRAHVDPDSWAARLGKDEPIPQSTKNSEGVAHNPTTSTEATIPMPKFIELERTLNSVVHLYLILAGTKNAYHFLIQKQAEPNQLTFAQYQDLNEKFLTCLTNPPKFLDAAAEQPLTAHEMLNTLVAMLVYSDLGKTPGFKKKIFETFEDATTASPDHDDLLSSIFGKDKNTLSKILPSFKNLNTNQQQLMCLSFHTLQIHLGHFSHLECGPQHLERFVSAVSFFPDKFEKPEKMQDTDFFTTIQSLLETTANLNMMLQWCDVSAASGQLNLLNCELNTATMHRYTLLFDAVQVYIENRLISTPNLEQLYVNPEPHKPYKTLQEYELFSKHYGQNTDYVQQQAKMLWLQYFNLYSNLLKLEPSLDQAPKHPEQLQNIITTLCAMMRITDPDEAQQVQQQLSDSMLSELAKTFDPANLKSIFYWQKNPTYMPTGMINIFKHYSQEGFKPEERFKHAVNYAYCVSKLLQNLYNPKHDASKPICLSGFAKLATEAHKKGKSELSKEGKSELSSEDFSPEHFEPALYYLDKEHNVKKNATNSPKPVVFSKPDNTPKLESLTTTTNKREENHPIAGAPDTRDLRYYSPYVTSSLKM